MIDLDAMQDKYAETTFCQWCRGLLMPQQDGAGAGRCVECRRVFSYPHDPDVLALCDEVEQRRARDALYAHGLHWLGHGPWGTSSLAMLLAAMGHAPREEDRDHPLDAGDFRRCMWMLDAVPEVREHFDAVAAMSSEWGRLIARWPEVEAVFNKESDDMKEMSKTNALLREIRQGGPAS